MAANGHVLSRYKGVRAKPKAGLVVVGGFRIVVECPKGMFFAARSVHQTAHLLFVRPETADATVISQLLPLVDIDVPARVERRDELVAMAERTGGELLRTRQLKTNSL